MIVAVPSIHCLDKIVVDTTFISFHSVKIAPKLDIAMVGPMDGQTGGSMGLTDNTKT